MGEQRETYWKYLHAGALVSVLVVLWAAVCARHIATTEFHGDESGWITAAFHYADLVARGDFSRGAWRGEDCAAFGDLNPHVGKLMIGVPLRLYAARQLDGERFAGVYRFDQEPAWNIAQGRIPPPAILVAARGICAVVGLLVLVAAFAMGARLGGLWTGFAAALLLLLNPQFLLQSTRAFTDMPYLLFLLLGVYFALALASAATPATRWRALLGCAIATGLAASVKITGLPLLAAGTLAVLLLLCATRAVALPHAALQALVYGLVALGMVYALNPWLWPEFHRFDAPQLAVELYRALVDRAPVPFPFAPGMTLWDALTAATLRREEIAHAYPQLSALLLPPAEFFLLFPRWSDLLRQIVEVDLAPAPTLAQIHANLLWNFSAFRGEVLLIAAGMVLLSRQAVAGLRAGRATAPAALLAAFFVQYGLLVLTLPIAIDRYYLPTLALAAQMGAVGLAGIARGLAGVFRREARP